MMLKMISIVGVIFLFLNIKISLACIATRGGGGGDISACTSCSQLTIRTGSGVGVDEPITQTTATNGAGCRTVTVTCTSATAGTEVVLFNYQNGQDRGTSTGTTTVSETMVCNGNGQLVLTNPTSGQSTIVTEVECLSAGAANACTTCTQIPVTTGAAGPGLVDEPVTQTLGTDANGCTTVTVTCTSASGATDLNYFWENNGVDFGTSTGPTPLVRTLTCDATGELELTENGVTGDVDNVKCVSLGAPAAACTTCTQVTVVNTGLAINRPVMQATGTNAAGCTTVTVSCTTPTAGAEINLFWTQGTADRGISDGITTVSRTLVCNAMGQLELTEPGGGATGIVDTVECGAGA